VRNVRPQASGHNKASDNKQVAAAAAAATDANQLAGPRAKPFGRNKLSTGASKANLAYFITLFTAIDEYSGKNVCDLFS